ncbi:MAG TPA: O-antigen ligase family protein [Candidatus Omnitrophota bacterium]|nr:O-antigen ligase family protein [Candidatus Omnitrophota bacterium]HPD84067.1 O-antigen ligase family protein [Candidatus Omnitrophota bacterium]HRZ02924.1 O-antigen ligase family protein [Candidatus Omnitrophota bacterium]
MNKEKLVLWCDKAMVFAFCALIYFTPISIALVEIFAVIVLVFFFIKRGIIFYADLKNLLGERRGPVFVKAVRLFLKSFAPVKNYLNRPIGIFILIGFFSIFISKYPILSIKGFFFKLLEWTFLYFTFIECFSDKKRLKIFVTVFMASAVLVCLSGFIQQFTKVDFIRGYQFSQGRITSSFNHANNLAAYLLIVSLIFFAFASFNNLRSSAGKNMPILRRPILLRLLYAGLFALSMICLGLTYSRGAWVAFIAALLFLGLSKRKVFPVCVLVIAVFLAVFLPLLSMKRNVSFSSDNTTLQLEQKTVQKTENQPVGKPAPKQQNFNASGRIVFWNDAVKIIREFPLGIGLNTYSKVSYKYDQVWGGYPHNCYLQLAAEMGILGLLVFLWLMIVLFKNSIRHLQTMNDEFLTALLAGSLAGLLGFMLHSGVDTNFYSVQLGNLMWVVMGVIVAVQQIDLAGRKG